jgi:putative DNA primase/helicase
VGKIDFDRINEAALSHYPDILHEWLPGGHMEGHEYRCGDLSGGQGDSLGVNTRTGKWGDFAAGQSGGDPVSLYAACFFNGDQGAAAKALADRLGLDTRPDPAPRPQQKTKATEKQTKEEYINVLPVPDDAGEPQNKHYRLGEPSARWPYLDAGGRLLGFVCRFDLPGGGKEVVPLIYGEGKTSGRRQWRWQSFDKPRPMYGLDRLAARQDANVVLVEGEKCADALQSLFPELAVVSWPGGGKAVKHCDFGPLAGRKVVAWPDFDAKRWPEKHRLAGQMMPYQNQPGPSAMLEILGAVSGRLAGARILTYKPGEVEDGWDCADAVAEGWTAERVMAFIQERMVDPAQNQNQSQNHEPDDAPPEPPESAGADYGGGGEDDYTPDGEFCLTDLSAPSVPFQCLGYDHGSYFYLPRGTRQVVELKACEHSQKQLMIIAPLQWWERNYPGRKGPAWGSAANAMFRHQEKLGIYSPTRVRGRGAWEDQGRSVLHLGDYLMVDGRRVGIDEIDSRHIYEASEPMNQGVDSSPLSPKETHHFAEFCKLLCWERPISSMLLAGWCVVAPICGALRWRPHIWVTGSAGSGKSWVMDNIVRPIVGPAALMVQGNTTEAGLRQSLKYDARPVLFDEAEGEDKEAQKRIKTVLELMRQASTETGAEILKGSTNGQVVRFRIRSCFAMSSIGVGLQQHADISRVTVLSLVRNDKPGATEDFKDLCRMAGRIITPDFCAGLRARAISMVPIIRKNADTFGQAAAEHLGSQRIGDQLGALLAGTYSLYKSSEVTLDEAREWVSKQDWSEQRAIEESRDEDRCMSAILEAVLRVQGDKAGHDLSIAELIERAANGSHNADVTPTIARDTLLRHGIRVETAGIYALQQCFIVANTHRGIEKILSNTPWQINWSRTLARIRGARTTENSIRFNGSKSRGVEIPLDYVVEG